MPTLIAPKSSASHPLAPEGSHLARCISMIDLGTHETTGQFGTKRQRKIRLSFELPNELHVFNEEKGEQPFIISQNFTFSMHEKSKLRAFLENWRGKKFSEEEAAAFDTAKLIGVPAMLSVMHNTKAGRTYANVGAASRLPKGLDCPPQVIPPVVFSLAEFDQRVFDALPDWMREEIANSDEYRAMVANEEAAAGVGSPMSDHGDADDIPF